MNVEIESKTIVFGQPEKIGSPARTPFGFAQGKLTAELLISANFFITGSAFTLLLQKSRGFRAKAERVQL